MGPLAETPRFVLRMPLELRARLEEIANLERRTLTNLIVYALYEWLEGRGRGQLPPPNKSE